MNYKKPDLHWAQISLLSSEFWWVYVVLVINNMFIFDGRDAEFLKSRKAHREYGTKTSTQTCWNVLLQAMVAALWLRCVKKMTLIIANITWRIRAPNGMWFAPFPGREPLPQTHPSWRLNRMRGPTFGPPPPHLHFQWSDLHGCNAKKLRRCVYCMHDLCRCLARTSFPLLHTHTFRLKHA